MRNRQIKKRIGTGTAIVITFLSFCIFGSMVPETWAKARESQVGLHVELDRGVLPANGAQIAVVKVTLDAPEPPRELERPPVNLAIVLDRSGSMSGQKIDKAKEAAIEALRRLGAQDLFSLIVYDDTVQTIVPAQSARNVEWIESRIQEIRSGGSTALFGGVSQGAAEVRKNLERRYVNRIILLSDGLANVGPDSPEDLGRLGAALIKEEISVTTVGVGTDYNEDLMTRLAQNSDGNSYFVESSVDLPRIFAAELGDVLSVVAKQVHIIIECPDGIKPIRVIGREGRIKGSRVELSMNQLYGGQEKYALVEVSIPAGKSGESIEIATAKVTYENPFTQKRETTKGRAEATFSKDEKKVERSVNLDVQKDLQLNIKALAVEEAITFSDEGKPAAAASTLKSTARKLKEFGSKYKDDEALQQAEELEMEADMIEQRGMSKKQRKEMKTRSFQERNQQLRQ